MAEARMRPFKLIRDPKAFQLIGDDTRRRVIYLLRAKDMTVAMIAQELGMTPQAIYHHIAKLREVEMVEVAKEERVGHIIETYYRATAEIFQFSHGEAAEDKAYAEHAVRQAILALPQMGFEVEIDDEKVARIVEVAMGMGALGEKAELEEKAAKLENVDFLTKQDVSHYAKFLFMSDEQFDKYIEMTRELRSLLQATLVRPLQT